MTTPDSPRGWLIPRWWLVDVLLVQRPGAAAASGQTRCFSNAGAKKKIPTHTIWGTSVAFPRTCLHLFLYILS